MQEHITLKSLAQKLGLSVSSVSKALRDSHEISPKTKARVLAMARRLNYIPNPYASSLRRKRSKTIAVVIPEVDDNFFSLAIKGIEAVAQQKEYHVLIYLTHESFEKEQAILQEFKSGRVDGILMSVSMETTTDAHIEALCQQGMPVIMFDRTLHQQNLAKITTDDFDSTYKATCHLLACGCKKIAFLSISPNLSIGKDRAAGYRQAMTDQSNSLAPAMVVECSNLPAQQHKVITKLLSQHDPPDGIIAAGEKLSIMAYQVCHELHISIPDTVKILGFFNLDIAPLLSPPLTTITQSCYAMGITAANALFKALEKPHFDPKAESIIIPSELIVRASTATDKL